MRTLLIVLATVLATSASPRRAEAQYPPAPGPEWIRQRFLYNGCDVVGSTLRSCTLLEVLYDFAWDPRFAGYFGGPWTSGTTIFGTPGTVDCARAEVPRGNVRPCFGPIQGNFAFLTGSVGYQLGGCNDVCLYRGGAPDPFAFAPLEIRFAVAYGPAGGVYDPFADAVPPGVTRSSYTLTRISPVPEPTTMVLAATGLAGVAFLARRRRT